MAQDVASVPAALPGMAANIIPSARRRGMRHTYGALDLGTNNCRLLIARPTEGGFTVVDAFSRIVRLGEGLSQSGRLSDAAMDRAVGALAVCADKLRRRNVSLSNWCWSSRARTHRSSAAGGARRGASCR
jgi:exopolyphosphatase / guanosine-5'-triphosphate,3'-diphosphate pyrophosphatase